MVEQSPYKIQVAGSTPTPPTNWKVVLAKGRSTTPESPRAINGAGSQYHSWEGVELYVSKNLETEGCAREGPGMTLEEPVRADTKPTLVYWHQSCEGWWPLTDGPRCPFDDSHFYDSRARKGRKRLMWICEAGSGESAYLSRRDYLEHDEEWCG